jgi:pantetheine-phosphate adenylyltransferase
MSHDRPAPVQPQRVLYPGSFDPIHLGHVDVIEQALELFGAVTVAVMHNPGKPSDMLFEVGN